MMGSDDWVRWAAKRAMRLYDQGKFESAVICFLDDIGKHAVLKGRSKDPELKLSLRANSGNRDKFEQTMLSCCDKQLANT